jgi:hypothetical protein
VSQEKFDPRDMISPPWRQCPACGKDKVGVHFIDGSELMRRCRDCWHKRFYPLPKLRKQVIYLDQFVVSNLMKLDNSHVKGRERVAAEPFWRELRDLLVNWSKDVDQALAEAKKDERPILLDFSVDFPCSLLAD